MPARARISPLRGSSAATPPSRPASATTAASWRPVSDGRPDRLGGARLCAREHAVPRNQLAARAPAQPLLERLLEAALADGPVRGEAVRVQRARAPRRSPAAPCAQRSSRRSHQRRGARRRRARARTLPSLRAQRGAQRGHADAAEALALAQLGEHEPRRPVHMLARHRDAQVAAEAAEHACLDHNRHGHVTAVQRLRVARFEVGHRGGGGRAAVGAPEARDRKARACLVAQQIVHRRAVAARPGIGEVARHPLGLRSGARPDDRARRQRHGREPCKGREGAMGEAPSALGGNALHGRGTVLGRCARWYPRSIA